MEKSSFSPNQKLMHFSVGALIKKDGKILMINRKAPPYGWACVAGHIDVEETPEQAILREVKEESNLDVIKQRLIFEELVDWNFCSKGANVHYWYVFECDFKGNVKHNENESLETGWKSVNELKELQLEPVWAYWFKKLRII